MIIDRVVPNKLHQEFVNVGIKCTLCHNLEDGRYFVGDCEVKFAKGTDMNLVQQIIDAHDPTPLQPIPTKEEVLEQGLANTNAMILELTELILGGM